jgi:hypothetical protein
VFLKADISTSISDMITYIDVAIAKTTASTQLLPNRAASIDGALELRARQRRRPMWQMQGDYPRLSRILLCIAQHIQQMIHLCTVSCDKPYHV